MEVEVVLREIGERPDPEGTAVHAPELEGVARHLHHDRVHALLEHRGEETLQFRGLRRGQCARLPDTRDAGLDRADQPHRMTVGHQGRLGQIAGGGLARRTGDAYERHPA
jgi:hypothetical protein